MSINFYQRASSFGGYVRSLRADLTNYIDIDQLFVDARSIIYNELNVSVVLRIRLIICVCILFEKTNNHEIETKNFYFCSKAERILSNTMIYEKIDNAFKKIRESIDSFIRNGSNWVVKKIQYIDLHIGNYRDIRGGCIHAAQLPARFKNKQSLLNIQCRDNKCFIYNVIAKLYPMSQKSKNYRRVTNYKKYVKYFNMRGITYPVKLCDVPKFEKLNNLIINVFSYEDNEIYPLYISKKRETKRAVIDLFLYEKHYYLIKNLSSFLQDPKKKNSIRYFCRNCLNGFQRQSSLISHKEICEVHKPQKLSLPTNFSVKFNALPKMLYHPFSAFADFECITQKISTALPCSSKSFTCQLEKHEAVSYTLIVIDINDRIIFHEFYVGVDAATKFLITLKKVFNKVMEKMKKIVPMNTNLRTDYDKNTCHICQNEFKIGEIRTRDHSHWSTDGHIRGLAHQSCNLNMRATYFLPVVIHNSKNYDNHLILKGIPQNYVESVYIIPVNTEKFTMFYLDSVKFIDSFQFLDSSLESLVQNLKKSDHKFNIFNQFFENENEENKKMLLGKGIFPYSYFESLSILEEKSLPPKNAFYNQLTKSNISDEDYEHACAVYKAFKCKTFSDYLELYQNLDVVLLSEVFTSFRRTSISYYKLDPIHFVTSADLTWNAGLKLSKIELELFRDINDYIWLENHMRGGICLLGKRYAVANDPYIPESYNSNIENSFIFSLDANNLYGYSMIQSLPYGNFHWLTLSEIQNFNILQTTENSPMGFILEVDLLYPTELHNMHDDLPMAVEHLHITYDMLSPHAKRLCDSLNLKHLFPCKKLTPNFFNKKNYVCYYLNLKFYVENGLKITKIHKILTFSQKPWLEQYINFNNEKRKNATSEFEKGFFKKMNNSFYGKTCQNIRKRINIKAAVNVNQCKKYLSNPSLEYFEIVNDFLTLFKCKKVNLIVDKPIYVGFVVLELSKLKMYSLYYNYFKKFYKEKCTLLYMDTDSLYLNIKSENAYKDLKKYFHHILDLSNYDPKHEMFDSKNKGVLGKLKNEKCLPIKEFIGLKCKLYSVSYGTEAKIKAKGVKKSSLKDITVDTFKNILQNNSYSRHMQHSIISKNHLIYTIVQNKISLSCFYDKKFLMDNSIDCRSYGHILNNNIEDLQEDMEEDS